MAAADVALAAEIGVSPDVIEDIRRSILAEGSHWERREGGRIAFTEMGIEAVYTHLQIPRKAFLEQKERSTEALCEIVRCMPNPAFVRIRTPDGGLSLVRVRSNLKLAPRMRLRCRPNEGGWLCCQPGLAVQAPASST